MGKTSCPKCGSSDCKERRITLGMVAEAAAEFGFQAVKSRFTSKMDYQKAFDNSADRLNPNNTTRRSYRCMTCGYTWDSGQ